MDSNKWDDPKWLDFSSNLKKKRGWKCEKCGYVGGNLRVHHLAYSQNKNREPWDYHERHLKVLCSKCHSNEHNIKTISDDECLRDKDSKKIILLKKSGRPSRFPYDFRCIFTEKQVEVLSRIAIDLGKISNRDVSLGSTTRFIVEIMGSWYSRNENWVKDIEMSQHFIKENYSNIY